MASMREKARRELLALAEEWTGPGELLLEGGGEVRYWARQECASHLREAVDRLFPVKPPVEAEAEDLPPIVTFPVLGGGTYGVGPAKLAELARLYEVPEAFLLDQFGIVAAKLAAGATSKKTRRGMPRALFAWCVVAKRIYDARSHAAIPGSPPPTPPPPTNGKFPRVVTFGGEPVALFRGQTYRQEQWPAEFGPWPGGA